MDSPSVCLSSPQTVLWSFVLLLPWSWATVFNHFRVACCLRCQDFHNLQDLTCCVWLLPLVFLCTITFFFYQKQQESTRQHKQASGLEPHCCPVHMLVTFSIFLRTASSWLPVSLTPPQKDFIFSVLQGNFDQLPAQEGFTPLVEDYEDSCHILPEVNNSGLHSCSPQSSLCLFRMTKGLGFVLSISHC